MTLPQHRDACWAGRMMIGGKIMLHTGLDVARTGLADLAGRSWVMSLPEQWEERGGHPAGRGLPAHAAANRGGLVVVVFGQLTEPCAKCTAIPVRWESLEPGDGFTVLLDADITLGPAEDGVAVLTLAGFCRPSGVLISGGHELARLRVTEATRMFITSVADAVTCSAASGARRQPAGPALSWVSELPGSL